VFAHFLSPAWQNADIWHVATRFAQKDGFALVRFDQGHLAFRPLHRNYEAWKSGARTNVRYPEWAHWQMSTEE
jgi:hypothetical protein